MILGPRGGSAVGVLAVAVLGTAGLGGSLFGLAGANVSQDRVVLVGGTLIDGRGGPPIENATIVMEEGRISSIAANLTEPFPEDVDVRSIAGKWIVPGLIDAHVHLATNPAAPEWRRRTEAQLEAMVRGGVTSVRDMAGDARAFPDLVDALARNEIMGPDVYYSALFAGPDFFDDPRVKQASIGIEPGDAHWARALTMESAVDEAVRQAAATGATGLKVYAAVSAPLLARISAEAHRRGMKVWSHATIFPAKPAEAVDAGVDVLSHAAYLVWEGSPRTDDFTRRALGDFEGIPVDHPDVSALLDQMARLGTLLDATLLLMDRLVDRDDAGPRRLEWSADVVRAANQRGVRIVAGTDLATGSGRAPPVHGEMAILVERAGLSPMEALVAATRNAAAAIGIESRVGTIEVGKEADVLILGRDPLADIRNTLAIEQVFKRGVALIEP